MSQTTQIYFITALISVSTVVAIYVFVGNSGVLSFGHISFFAVGVWAAGVLSVPEAGEAGDDAVPLRLPELDHGRKRAVAPDRGRRGRGLRAARGPAADAPLGPRRRHRDVRRARDHEQPPSLLREDRAGAEHVLVGARDDRSRCRRRSGPLLVIIAAFAYQRSRLGRQLRATREDPAAARAVGVSIYRQRLASFALSGFLAGFAGGLYIHFIPINVDAVYLDLTFITLAMLVIGGTTSLWGAVVGALFVSALDSVLAEMEDGMTLLGRTIDLPSGSRIVVVSAVMALVLIVRPSGLTGGREFSLPSLASSGRRAAK